MATKFISKDIDNFIFDVLTAINEKFDINLMLNTDLRIALALHLIPLLTRLKYNMQLKNEMKDEIKQSFPYAYEISIIVAQAIHEHFGYSLSEDEISYIALHFNVNIENQLRAKSQKKILLISCNRTSSSLLIYQKISKKFSNRIQKLSIVTLNQLSNIDFNDYDVILTTSLKYHEIPKNAIRINEYIDSNDCNIIEEQLDKDLNKLNLHEYIHDDLIFNGTVKNKNEIIEKLCTLASNKYGYDVDELIHSVKKREQLGFTSYGNFVAIPHTMESITDKTFISVGILKKPIIWNDNEKVYLVFLVSISQTYKKGLHTFYNELSNFISNKVLVEKVIQNPTIDNFKKMFFHNHSIS